MIRLWKVIHFYLLVLQGQVNIKMLNFIWIRFSFSWIRETKKCQVEWNMPACHCEQADIHEPLLRVQIWGMSNQEQTGAGLKTKKQTQHFKSSGNWALPPLPWFSWNLDLRLWGIWSLLSSHRVRHHRSIYNWSWTGEYNGCFRFWNSGVSLFLVDLIFELCHVFVDVI